MISVIICSVNKQQREAIAVKIAGTIGVTYELIVIENDIENLSICAAYNKGAGLAKYAALCFIHEDCSFHSPDWGKSLLSHLEKESVGFLGLAGSTLKTRNPSPWWIANDSPLANRFHRTCFIQSGTRQQTPAGNTDLLQQVVCLDGFFLACSRTTWERIRFDEKTLTGFHFYDLDICLAAHSEGRKNYVFTDCLIEHHSTGSFNERWLISAEKFQDKWQLHLPLSIEAVPAQDLEHLEQLALVEYIHTLIAFRYRVLAFKYITRLLWKYKRTPEAIQVVKLYGKRLLHL